ncbi:Bax inhibitor-1/YccA family protein [Candidatus Pandoraea novymonadis]|uniref:Modulator of FtsH protease YccA n=1 Tax=Candidatus Pandoraea novymonadis TaxID=1808959 RepID=A0ABX5FDX2_9BURK|nr:Bax inhibitor-1/YccA family protein [Candidatus Pandoraea novymonadis]PSB91926.1 Modulator of FtsH protease YccA [Candidatus Pandoraea novymonadis]
MNQDFQNFSQSLSNKNTSVRTHNRVLRNTYWLLALSMLPTVVGAWIGVRYGLMHFAAAPIIRAVGFLVVAFCIMSAIEKFKHSGVGVVLLLGFTFFMGIMLTPLLGHILGYVNGATLIMTAFGGTATIFGVMASIATVSKRDFSNMSKWLFVGVMLILISSVANIWLQLPALTLTVSTLAIAIFSAYILFDVQRVVNKGETNYITATLAIYLDLYNVFANLLSILGIFGGNRS